MTHSTGQFPNETYLEGLRNNPESTLAVLYNEFRAPVLNHLLTSGNHAESTCIRCFQLAILDVAYLARAGQFPQEESLPDVLRQLARAHLNDLEENATETASEADGTEQHDTPELEEISPLPDAAARLGSRNKVQAWELLLKLEEPCRQRLLGTTAQNTDLPLSELAPEEPSEAWCKEKFLEQFSTDEAPLEALPAWANAALADSEGYAMWRRTEVLETEWAAEEPPPTESNRIWRWAIGLLLLAVVGYGAYQFYFRPKTAAEVFADNFSPPGSLMDDLQERYGAEMGNDSVTARPGECMLLLREADAYYQAHEYQLAMDPLLLIVMDSASICQSDAWFYLGIVQLHLEDPATAIQCFAKIEDLGKFGEDLYWYQALAFVQLAKENPLMRDRARRAVERALGNTRNPKRQEQAQKMLDHLSH